MRFVEERRDNRNESDDEETMKVATRLRKAIELGNVVALLGLHSVAGVSSCLGIYCR
jgi:hypothetical protein